MYHASCGVDQDIATLRCFFDSVQVGLRPDIQGIADSGHRGEHRAVKLISCQYFEFGAGFNDRCDAFFILKVDVLVGKDR